MSDKKILIIEDDNRNIFALKAVLKARNYVAVSTTDAREGIRMLGEDNGIKVVLLDMMMPDVDGYEALKRIRGNPAIAAIPVIAVTAQAMVGDREKCLAAGADGYISKPIDIDVLVGFLDQYIK